MLSERQEQALASLKQNGVVLLPALSSSDIIETNNYLSKCLAYNGHVRAKSNQQPVCVFDAVGRQEWPMFCVDMRDAVLAPHLFETVLSYYEFAKAYFGETPRLYSMNVFWTQPVSNGHVYQDTHGWHRDADDRKQLTLFIYGLDVPENDAAHLYQVGTHVIPDDKLGRDFRSPPPHIVKSVAGFAGTVFAADTGGLHMGKRPHGRPRMLAWGRFGVSNPPQSYYWDALKPVDKALLGSRYPTNPELQDAVRLVTC